MDSAHLVKRLALDVRNRKSHLYEVSTRVVQDIAARYNLSLSSDIETEAIQEGTFTICNVSSHSP